MKILKIANKQVKNGLIFVVILIVFNFFLDFESTKKVLLYKNLLIIKILFFIISFYIFSFIFKKFLEKYKILQEKEEKLFELPKSKIMDFILKNDDFSEKNVIKKLKTTQQKARIILQKLEKIEVLKRGEKNKRVLNPSFYNFSESDLYNFLKNKENFIIYR